MRKLKAASPGRSSFILRRPVYPSLSLSFFLFFAECQSLLPQLVDRLLRGKRYFIVTTTTTNNSYYLSLSLSDCHCTQWFGPSITLSPWLFRHVHPCRQLAPYVFPYLYTMVPIKVRFGIIYYYYCINWAKNYNVTYVHVHKRREIIDTLAKIRLLLLSYSSVENLEMWV